MSGKCNGRDLVGAAKTELGIRGLAGDLVDDAKIVVGVGEIRMRGTETGLLQVRGLEQQTLGGREVAGVGGLLGFGDDSLGIARVRHESSSWRPKNRDSRIIVYAGL